MYAVSVVGETFAFSPRVFRDICQTIGSSCIDFFLSIHVSVTLTCFKVIGIETRKGQQVYFLVFNELMRICFSCLGASHILLTKGGILFLHLPVYTEAERNVDNPLICVWTFSVFIYVCTYCTKAQWACCFITDFGSTLQVYIIIIIIHFAPNAIFMF